jgi:hypothetical protein
MKLLKDAEKLGTRGAASRLTAVQSLSADDLFTLATMQRTNYT